MDAGKHMHDRPGSVILQDKELIELIRNRDPRGAELFQRNYSPLIRYVINPVIKDESDREECLSDVCMRVWNRIESFDPGKGSWTTWITAIARNAALSRTRRMSMESEELAVDIPDNSQDPESAVLRSERLQALNEALSRLRKKDRIGYILFYRKYYYLQSTAQIAAELGMTVKAVESRLYRVKRQLREELGGAEDE